MKISLPFDHKMTGRGMLPDGTDLDVTLNPVKQAFRRLKAQIVAGWNIEHKPDGAHADITADLITLGSMQLANATFQGTWTPTLGGAGGTSGQTYAVRVGRYLKLGLWVVAVFHCEFTAKGTITGAVQVQGLPYTAALSSESATAMWVSALRFDSLATNWVSVMASVTQGATVAAVTGAAAAAANNSTALVTGDLNDTSGLRGTLIYRAAS